MAPSIAQERSRLAKVAGAPSLRRREQWGARHDYTRARTVTDPATRVFIHISVTNPGNYRSNDAHARAIEAIGRARFGTSPSNTGVSYNRGVMPDAVLYEMQPMGRRGAHTVNNYGISTCTRSGTGCPGRGQSLTAPSGNLNYNARAYVLCQNVDDPVTDEQIDQLARQIVADHEAGLIIRHACHHPHGHRCVSAKSCPGNRMWARMDDLHDRIHHYLDNGLGDDDMSWNEDLSPGTPGNDITNLANETLPDNWGRAAADLLGYAAAGFAYLSRKTFSRPQMPDKSHWRLHSFIRWGYTHSAKSRAAAEEALQVARANGSKLDALMDAHQGMDLSGIKAHIDERYAAAATERAELADKLDAASELLEVASTERAEMQTLVEQALSGERDAAEVLRVLAELIRREVGTVTDA